jgi:hypothetical protein
MSTSFPDYLSAFVKRALATPPAAERFAGLEGVPERDWSKASDRYLLTIDTPPSVERRETYTVEEARNIARTAIRDYTDLVEPEHMLLIRMAPGTGKSHIAAGIAGELAAKQRRVFWAAPRHDFFGDLRTLLNKQGYLSSDLYEWQPRQTGDDETGKQETCLHVESISAWMNRGYDGLDFCSRVCGWDFINKHCAYHAQKNRSEAIVMGVHQHVTLGHPLNFNVVIGDESPLTTFEHQWVIPGRHVMPPDMDMEQPLTEVMHRLNLACASREHVSGPTLLQMLGGAQAVYEACNTFWVAADAKKFVPTLHTSDDVAKAPYFHLPELVPILQREADAALSGIDYAHRVWVGNGNLLLLLRREVNATMPKHLIWLDATGDEHLYRAMFRRPVKVIAPYVEPKGRLIQVTGRSNNRSSLFRTNAASTDDAADNAASDEAEVNPERLKQLETQVRHIVAENDLRRPGIISYKAITAALEKRAIPGARYMHFYGARGANGLEDVDGLIVAGTPMPNTKAIEKLARMIWFERRNAYDSKWRVTPVPFNYTSPDGKGKAFPSGGFWHDPDLQSVLWQMREAEMIQAVHRARLVNRDVTVWLLSNLPIAELPPTELVELRDLLGAPEETDIFLWAQALRIAAEMSAAQGFVTTADLKERLGMDRRTAWKYIERIAAMEGWDLGAVRRGVGKPTTAAIATERSH